MRGDADNSLSGRHPLRQPHPPPVRRLTLGGASGRTAVGRAPRSRFGPAGCTAPSHAPAAGSSDAREEIPAYVHRTVSDAANAAQITDLPRKGSVQSRLSRVMDFSGCYSGGVVRMALRGIGRRLPALDRPVGRIRLDQHVCWDIEQAAQGTDHRQRQRTPAIEHLGDARPAL